jgi:hypothetical protein
MQNARIPGDRRRGMVLNVKRGWWSNSQGDSNRRCDKRREMNITGARWKSVEKGLRVAGVCWRRSCVNDHRRPDNADAVITRRNLPQSDI